MSVIIKKIPNEKSQIGEISQILDEIKNIFNLEGKIVFTLHLILEEIITNIINYAYGDNLPHLIGIKFSLDKDKANIMVEIEDDGIPFNPLLVPPSVSQAPLEEREPGKMGLHLVRSYVDGMEYKREDNKNILLMKKKIL